MIGRDGISITSLQPQVSELPATPRRESPPPSERQPMNLLKIFLFLKSCTTHLSLINDLRKSSATNLVNLILHENTAPICQSIAVDTVHTRQVSTAASTH